MNDGALLLLNFCTDCEHAQGYTICVFPHTELLQALLPKAVDGSNPLGLDETVHVVLAMLSTGRTAAIFPSTHSISLGKRSWNEER